MGQGKRTEVKINSIETPSYGLAHARPKSPHQVQAQRYPKVKNGLHTYEMCRKLTLKELEQLIGKYDPDFAGCDLHISDICPETGKI